MSCVLQPKRRMAGRSEPAGHTAPDQATKADTAGLRQNKAAKIGRAQVAGVVKMEGFSTALMPACFRLQKRAVVLQVFKCPVIMTQSSWMDY